MRCNDQSNQRLVLCGLIMAAEVGLSAFPFSVIT